MDAVIHGNGPVLARLACATDRRPKSSQITASVKANFGDFTPPHLRFCSAIACRFPVHLASSRWSLDPRAGTAVGHTDG